MFYSAEFDRIRCYLFVFVCRFVVFYFAFALFCSTLLCVALPCFALCCFTLLYLVLASPVAVISAGANAS